jgi:hypothetical protein
MSGRGDNNKNGSAGRGGSNQSNQGFNQASNPGKSNHGAQKSGKRSEPQPKQQDQSSNRNTSTDKS